MNLVNVNSGAILTTASVKSWGLTMNSLASGGNYKITFTFTRDTLTGYPTKCNEFIMELSVIPQSVFQQRILSFNCPAQEGFPTIDFSPLLSGTEFHYTQDPALKPAPAGRRGGAVRQTKIVSEIAQTQRHRVAS